VIGVLAHEVGHIAGGHLARLDSALRDASTPALLANLLAAAAGILSRNPAAAVAVGSGGQQMIRRKLMSFSRVQERSADRAAVSYLDATRQSAQGLLEFLEILDAQQVLAISRRRQQELSYEITHPLTRDRIAFIRDHVAGSPYSKTPTDPALVASHARMVAKLKGFLDPPAQTLRLYDAADRGVPARYARAVAYYRRSDLVAALAAVGGLIAEFPGDPYFHELKAQILFENGRIAEALPELELAVRMLPQAPLLRIALAHAQIELNRRELLAAALANLRQAIRVRPTMALAWRLEATAYGRDGRLGMSALASAEYNLLVGRGGDARRMAQRAQRLLERGSPGWVRAADIIAAVRPERR
jgi:predicted Zn-dependent protease